MTNIIAAASIVAAGLVYLLPKTSKTNLFPEDSPSGNADH
jgi:hypothetical protein